MDINVRVERLKRDLAEAEARLKREFLDEILKDPLPLTDEFKFQSDPNDTE